MNGDFLTTAFNRIRSRLNRTDFADDDSDDALQDAFCRLWTRRDSIKDESQAEGLLAVTSRNIRIDGYRRKSIHPSVGLEDAGEPSEQPDGSDETGDIYRRVECLVKEVLSPRDREILFLRDRDGWDFEDLSERFGLTESNLRLIVSRSRKAIREIYRKQNGDY